ncbi:MAG TPA: hypothetical protein VEA38_16840 [Terriglobales bacterium]|nr:hypothetical protein [Terriglobales bacterium]
MIVRLWIREDGEQPKAVAIDATKGPGPGAIFDVTARSADEARSLYACSRRTEPDQDADPAGWIEWKHAKRAVKEVSRG